MYCVCVQDSGDVLCDCVQDYGGVLCAGIWGCTV